MLKDLLTPSSPPSLLHSLLSSPTCPSPFIISPLIVTPSPIIIPSAPIYVIKPGMLSCLSKQPRICTKIGSKRKILPTICGGKNFKANI
ncbi:unnamed protein product [Moneuplotes crassus]|uniref:Uncharacterized protein n=1 Tax=Euplotes crassus TaxID=5936 RepID=A0AAD1UNC9_EUPCR|nr:unnamed protein product [Moneuplotes crassus]